MSSAIASSRVVVDGSVIPATIVFSTSSGKIVDILPEVLTKNHHLIEKYDIQTLRDLSPHVIMPGLVDAHVHLNEPGRTEWEGFATGTQSAASGGVTTVIDMPLNAIPPTTNIKNLNIKLESAKGQIWVDTGFWGGLVPDNLDDLLPLINAGVRGFKGFMMDSGVEEFPMITPEYISNALQVVKGKSTMLMFHAEMDSADDSDHEKCDSCDEELSGIEDVKSCAEKHQHYDGLNDSQVDALAHTHELHAVEPLSGTTNKLINHHEDQLTANEVSPLALAMEKELALKGVDPRSYASFLASRPDSFECTAIKNIIQCMVRNTIKYMDKEPTTKVHIVHLATQEALPFIKHAQQTLKLPLTVETCFHYLSLSAEEIPDGATQYKCCPPIRSDENRMQLWKALKEGIITSVVSDHSPCTPELKGLERGDFFEAWGGISSVGFGLPLLYTVGTEQFGINITDIVEWCSVNTAKQVGLSHRKGRIAVGYDADFAIFDTKMEYTVANARTFFKNKLTAFDGKTLKGRVVETILRGNSIYALGKGVSDVPLGSLILEPRTD